MTVAKVGRGRTGTMQGRFIPKNPGKYVGDASRIIFRSSWELHFMKWVDNNASVQRWGSEEFSIKYLHPFKTDSAGRQKICNYYPDFFIAYVDSTGVAKREVIEIKPYNQTVLQPKMSDRDRQEYIVNQAKWKSAANFCAQNNCTFRVITEKTLFRSKSKKQKPDMSQPAPTV